MGKPIQEAEWDMVNISHTIALPVLPCFCMSRANDDMLL